MLRQLTLVLLFFCPVFSMAQDLCAKACVIHAECGIGGQCDQGLCKYQNSYCGNERWAVNSRGETSNCEAYRCSAETGLCLRKAESISDCLTGYVFDGVSACIPSVKCVSTDSHCQDFYERWKQARAEYEVTTPEPQPLPLTCQSCQADADCGSSQMCWKGACSEKKNYCMQDSSGAHFQVDMTSNEVKNCGLFVCEKVESRCLESCYKASDCRAGRSCVAGTCL